MKKMIVFALGLTCALSVSAQKYMTRTGTVSFLSKTPIETFEAKTSQANSSMNTATGDLAFLLLMKSFQFEKALMQEHFNEKYVESDKFPKATFTGKITNLSEVNFSKPGSYKASVTGDLTIHGVTQKVTTTGLIEVKADGIVVTAEFPIKVTDYGVKIPAATKDNVAETVTTRVRAELKPMEPTN